MSVFVLDRHKHPLMPCSEKRARLLLSRGRARIHRYYPFVIRLIDRGITNSEVALVGIGIDPGSHRTGMCIYTRLPTRRTAIALSILEHRGYLIRDNLRSRRLLRRRRRKSLRFRKMRHDNRTNGNNLRPSVYHRVETVVTWIARFAKWCPIKEICVEVSVFKTEFKGTTLDANMFCRYCQKVSGKVQKDHIVPKSKGGSDSKSNLLWACSICNQNKGSKLLKDFVANTKHIMPQNILESDRGTMNALQPYLIASLAKSKLKIIKGSGYETQSTRIENNLAKNHYNDAACVASKTEVLVPVISRKLLIKSAGRGRYKRVRADRYGFPRSHTSRKKDHFGFRTGDLVRGTVTKGLFAGSRIGKVSVRGRGEFVLTHAGGRSEIGYRRCELLQKADGYTYSYFG